jgi:hypothetical protein
MRTFVGYNVKGMSNVRQAIADDKENAVVVLKCACWNCSDIVRIDLTAKQIKKLNKILKTQIECI